MHFRSFTGPRNTCFRKPVIRSFCLPTCLSFCLVAFDVVRLFVLGWVQRSGCVGLLKKSDSSLLRLKFGGGWLRDELPLGGCSSLVQELSERTIPQTSQQSLWHISPKTWNVNKAVNPSLLFPPKPYSVCYVLVHMWLLSCRSRTSSA